MSKKRRYAFIFALILLLTAGTFSSPALAKKQVKGILAVSFGNGKIALFWPPAKEFYDGGGWQLQDRSTGKIIARWSAEDLKKGIATLPQQQRIKLEPFLNSLKSGNSQKEAQNQIGWLLIGAMTDFQLAQKLGLGVTLEKIGKKKRSYRLIIVNKHNKSTGKKLISPAIDSQHATPPPAMVNNLKGQGGSGGLELYWDTVPKQEIPTPTFTVERRSETGEKTNLTPESLWLSSERNPEKPAFIDPLAPFNVKLTYRIRLRDAFGRFSAPAKIMVQQVDPQATTPPEEFALETEKGLVKLTWKIKEHPYTTGYVIERSRRHDGLYTTITATGLKKKTHTYTDKKVEEGFTYYYRIRSVDTRGYVGKPSASKAIMVKSSKPKTPSKVKASVNRTNIHLSWQGQPLPVAGYIVEKRAEKDKTWVRLNSTLLTRSWFEDPINLKDFGQRSYRITAVAFGNQKSKPSREITVKLPGHPPVPAPLLTAITTSDGAIKLSFRPSEPAKRLNHYLLVRGTSMTDSGLVINKKIGRSKNTYTDKMVKPGEDYWYALIAVDKEGYRSKMGNKLFIVAGSPKIPQPKPPKVTLEVTPFRRATIRFTKPPGFLLAAVMRQVDNNSWTTISKDIKGTTEIIDTSPPAIGEVQYRVVYLDESHHWGAPSKSVVLKLE